MKAPRGILALTLLLRLIAGTGSLFLFDTGGEWDRSFKSPRKREHDIWWSIQWQVTFPGRSSFFMRSPAAWADSGRGQPRSHLWEFAARGAATSSWVQ